MPANCRRVPLQILADECRRDRCGRPNHPDVLPRPPNVAVGLKDLSGNRVYIWSRGNRLYAFEALSLPALLFIAWPSPITPPAIGLYGFFAVSLARSSARVAISVATCRAVK